MNTFKIKTHITGNGGLIAGEWLGGQTDGDIARIFTVMREATETTYKNGREYVPFTQRVGFARNLYSSEYGAYRYSIQGEKITVTLWVVREDY